MGFTIHRMPKGAPVAGTVVYRNIGDEEARIAAFEYVWVEDAPSPGKEAEQEDQLFDEFISKQIKDDIPTHTIESGQSFARWNFGPVLTREQDEGLHSGRKVIYFMGTVRYQGTSGARFHTDYCRVYSRQGVELEIEVARGRHNLEHVPLIDSSSAR